jgi:hypothetical protein
MYSKGIENNLAVLVSHCHPPCLIGMSTNQQWNRMRMICKNEIILGTGSHLMFSLCCVINGDNFVKQNILKVACKTYSWTHCISVRKQITTLQQHMLQTSTYVSWAPLCLAACLARASRAAFHLLQIGCDNHLKGIF